MSARDDIERVKELVNGQPWRGQSWWEIESHRTEICAALDRLQGRLAEAEVLVQAYRAEFVMECTQQGMSAKDAAECQADFERDHAAEAPA